MRGGRNLSCLSAWYRPSRITRYQMPAAQLAFPALDRRQRDDRNMRSQPSHFSNNRIRVGSSKIMATSADATPSPPRHTPTPSFWYRSRASDFFSVELSSPGLIFAGSVHRAPESSSSLNNIIEVSAQGAKCTAVRKNFEFSRFAATATPLHQMHESKLRRNRVTPSLVSTDLRRIPFHHRSHQTHGRRSYFKVESSLGAHRPTHFPPAS